MKIIIFDVNDAACSLIVSPNNYAMMIDCGCHSEKANPVDSVKNVYNKWLSYKPFTTSKGITYPLSLLHITHPDDDHVRNAKKVKLEFEPYLLRKTNHEKFPSSEAINQEYKDYIDIPYRGNNPESIEWGFDKDIIFYIPMEKILSDESLNKKPKNNSSILRFIEYKGIKILFGGDLETEGWNWLMNNDLDFKNVLSKGLDILVAPHHGHKSGFPSALFNLVGKVKISILSKATESEQNDTDVSSQYSGFSEGIIYKNLSDNEMYYASGTLTTRSNGDIFIYIDNAGNLSFYAKETSQNHRRISKSGARI